MAGTIAITMPRIPRYYKQRIGARAGKRNGQVPIVFAHDEEMPPTLSTPSTKRLGRLVLVGREWLRKHEPKAWAAICASRMLGDVEQVQIPTPSYAALEEKWQLVRKK